MLTSNDGLLVRGTQWPPACERGRINDIRDYFTLFNGQRDFSHFSGTRAANIFKAAFDRVVRDDYTAHLVVVNLFRVAVQTPCDLLYGEENEVRSAPDGEADPAHEWAEREKLWVQAYEATSDAMVAGDSYLRLVPDGNEARLSVIAPDIAFPVCQPDDCRKATSIVLAWKWNAGSDTVPDWRGTAEVHYEGWYERYSLTFGNDSSTIVSSVLDKTYQTGLKRLAIFHLASPNRRTNSYHGTSELADIDSLVAEIEVRLDQASRVLDKHSDPSINAPESAFQVNPETGAWELKAGSAFLLEKEDAPASYMVWDAGLGANWSMIDKLTDYWHMLTSLSPALWNKDGGVASGAALKRMMIPTLAKVSRWRESVEDVLREVVEAAGIIERFDTKSLTFDWSDGLPADPLETAQTVALQRAAGVQSRQSAIVQITGESGTTVKEELAAIEAERTVAAPAAPRISLGGVNNAPADA